MTREQAKQNLIGFGIAEPTDEQITNYLNQVGAETKKEKDRADGYKAKADQADDYKRQLEDLQSQGLTEAEKSAKALEAANNRIAELEKSQRLSAQKNSAMEKFKVTAEQANKIVKDDGTFDFDVLGQIIADKETAAVAAKEQELLDNTPNGRGGKGDTEKLSSAEQIADKYFAKSEGAKTSILSHYVGGN